RMGTTPVLEEGPLLIEAENGASVGVGADGEVVEIGRRAGVRIERGTAVEVGVYRGEATITSAGRDREVGALRASDLVAVGETTSVRPLDYRADDEWDRRFLGDAVGLDASIEALAAGARVGRIDPESFSERV